MSRTLRVSDKPAFFPSNSTTKVVEMGNVVGLTTFQKEPSPPPVKKLSADTYLDLRTQEVKAYEKSENRAENPQSIKRTFANLRAIINTNVTTPRNLRWVTLTYAENMRDPKKLYADFHAFWKRFLYYCDKRDIARPQYISVAEPQARGAWHLHCLFIWEDVAPFLDNNSVIWRLWGHGYTSIKAVPEHCDNIGAYFSAYLADMPVDDLKKLSDDEKNKALKLNCEIVEKTVDENGRKVKKNIIKGGRLRLYPCGMNIYRMSRGLKQPEITWTDLETAEKKVQAATCTFRKEYEIMQTDDNGKEETVTTIRKEYYNMKRPKKQVLPEKNFHKGLDRPLDS